MEELKTKERNNKKVKRKLMLVSAIMTVFAVLIIFIIISIMFWGKDDLDNDYIVPDSYVFSGNILSTNLVYSNISLVVEERDNVIYGVTLKNNELISEKILTDKIDYSKINDFSVVFKDYNNDGEKDFSYLFDEATNGYIYKFYSIDINGKIVELDIENVVVDSKKVSLKFGPGYKYEAPFFYYDGYKIPAEIGVHKLSEKSEADKKTISKASNIAIEDNYNALPRKVSILKEIPEYVQNANNYLLDADKKQGLEVDLDDDKQEEYIISFVKDNKTYVSLFDSSANFIETLLTVNGEKDISEMMEVADVDNDGIMEIVVIKNDSLEVHKFYNGFYY